ncbi:MAG: septum formation inhibitor Maf [Bacteroidetes bacterium]|nr:septum formation inhibitor Maf [Bacteroidota bacterium]
MRQSSELILASASPRRSDLLRQVGLRFRVVPSNVDEDSVQFLDPQTMVRELALMKAKAVAEAFPDALVLGADTTVVLNGMVVGKPTSASDARAILSNHSGKEHIVYSGFALVHLQSGRTVSDVASTRVKFGLMSSSEIDTYVDSGSPMDKAGAYGYQDALGPLFVESISGDYYNVIGLPLRALYLALRAHFPDIVRFGV